ncbi:hypothetical protein EJ07DRAFT_160453 [Lizonia empirigonia]|nr:hypothetical protein EJ07DRAFT_160453 [Lizonia empirigonia]
MDKSSYISRVQYRLLMEVLETVAGWQLDNVHLLMTSRKERDIESSLKNYVTRDVVDKDIQRYVQQWLSDDKALAKWNKDTVVRQEIETALTNGVRGMYVSMSRVCRNRAMLRKLLATLPQTLDQTYDHILTAISEDDYKYAIRILQWLTFSARPLSVEEIAEVVGIDVCEMDEQTSVISRAMTGEKQYPRVLDIGMAPGGFTDTVLRKHRTATIRGITLPQEVRGLEVMLPRWKSDSRILVQFLDVTMLADEIGRPTTSIPTTHPDVANFSSKRPFDGDIFDLIFCGATAQCAHTRADYRDSQERLRLVTSQLVVALQRLRHHGSLVLLMHKPEAFDTAEIISVFTKISNVCLFKPRKKHAIRSSFYMVVTGVDTQSEKTQLAILG